jgi:hypothetical protein
LVEIGAEGDGQPQDVMEIDRPGGLGDIAVLGLTLSETKRLSAAHQREIVAAQVREHTTRRPICSLCGGGCRVKEYGEHVAATLLVGSRCGFPDFVVPPVARSKRVSTGRRIARRQRNWSRFRTICPPI